VGGVDPTRRAGRDPIGKRLVGVAVEVRGAGSGRLRLTALEDASKRSLGPWVAANVEPGAIIPTDGRGGYAGPPASASITGRSPGVGAARNAG
jgi:ISXO2-like transposase domain